ncbi:hypothetical protein Cadr_000017679 [Camelus dromedarius]|uniref:Uncharacterized protein n=1 Tax=Camelus dromedarius TaxID=9838 RepID=A0A5N4D6F3_CAMDR|nr:hypothetical protein Cadr_000017679 [Camelus dromedarius]
MSVKEMFLIRCFLLDSTVKIFVLMTFYLEIYHGLLKQKIFMKFLIPLLKSMRLKDNGPTPGKQPGSRGGLLLKNCLQNHCQDHSSCLHQSSQTMPHKSGYQ